MASFLAAVALALDEVALRVSARCAGDTVLHAVQWPGKASAWGVVAGKGKPVDNLGRRGPCSSGEIRSKIILAPCGRKIHARSGGPVWIDIEADGQEGSAHFDVLHSEENQAFCREAGLQGFHPQSWACSRVFVGKLIAKYGTAVTASGKPCRIFMDRAIKGHDLGQGLARFRRVMKRFALLQWQVNLATAFGLTGLGKRVKRMEWHSQGLLELDRRARCWPSQNRFAAALDRTKKIPDSSIWFVFVAVCGSSGASGGMAGWHMDLYPAATRGRGSTVPRGPLRPARLHNAAKHAEDGQR